MNRSILIVEDDTTFGTMLQGWFRRNEWDAVLCSGIGTAKQELTRKKFNIVLCDLRLPDGDGIMLLQKIHDEKIDIPLIIMTSYGEVTSAVAAMKLGAKDFLEKPINPTLLKEKIEHALLPVEDKPTKIKADKKVRGMVLGESAAARVMYDHLLRVAPTKISVLILGESGTGKEYAARMIHDNSPRKSKPFIAVDCGSLSRELAPSELFGHVKGSFTSAVSDKVGVFVQANGGTVFLDEIGNLSYEVQMQLLRALQEQKVRPVGANADVNVDVRILSATNENLVKAIAEGRFREDLYYRLNELSVKVPSLSERREDIKLFVNEFLRQANEELEKDVKSISADALRVLENHHWNGNLRELRNTIRRIVLFATQSEISIADLPVLTTSPDVAGLTMYPGNEKEQIETALREARGNKSMAAKLLKIDRKTLYNKISLYGIK